MTSQEHTTKIQMHAERTCSCQQAGAVAYNIQACPQVFLLQSLIFLGELRMFGALFAVSPE